ncbi:MAG TPA: hypothetical protein VFF35_04830 [Bacteroidia bacterium]|nr:hypothetical protein [Bacteroidia bacterium]
MVHGEYKVQQDFKLKLIESGFLNVEIPEQGYTFETVVQDY